MARQLRSDLPDGIYHITAQAVHGLFLFLDDEDRRAFLWLVWMVTTRFKLNCRAYCLMGTHYHLVLEGRRVDMSRAMRRLNGGYARRFNDRRARSGHVFGDRYSAYVIRDERHLEDACRYIAANPVKAGLCNHVDEWPWTWIAGTRPHGLAPAFRH
jgi:REP element-mobilizing transposase RayT